MSKRIWFFLICSYLLIAVAFVGNIIENKYQVAELPLDQIIIETLEPESITEEEIFTTEEIPTEEEPITEGEEPPMDYPVAIEVWRAMKAQGWDDVICAGILGNMMQECGGRTFNLNVYAIGDNGNSYGLCQWNKYYHNAPWGEGVEAQVEYLAQTLDLKIFENCTTPREAAYAFCVNYERPYDSHNQGLYRGELADMAYDYFVNSGYNFS